MYKYKTSCSIQHTLSTLFSPVKMLSILIFSVFFPTNSRCDSIECERSGHFKCVSFSHFCLGWSSEFCPIMLEVMQTRIVLPWSQWVRYGLQQTFCFLLASIWLHFCESEPWKVRLHLLLSVPVSTVTIAVLRPQVIRMVLFYSTSQSELLALLELVVSSY